MATSHVFITCYTLTRERLMRIWRDWPRNLHSCVFICKTWSCQNAGWSWYKPVIYRDQDAAHPECNKGPCFHFQAIVLPMAIVQPHSGIISWSIAMTAVRHSGKPSKPNLKENTIPKVIWGVICPLKINVWGNNLFASPFCSAKHYWLCCWFLSYSLVHSLSSVWPSLMGSRWDTPWWRHCVKRARCVQ